MPDIGTQHRGGRPPFRPTDEHRRQVEVMVGLGIPADQIRRLILNPQTSLAIDEKTLRRHFREEIDRGQVKANAAVAQSLFKAATSGNVTAAIFWAKTRMGWKETNVTELTGSLSIASALDKLKGE